jgi:hypothetical protein
MIGPELPADGEVSARDSELAAMLQHRPSPTPGFRGALGTWLSAQDPGYGPRPRRLWTTVGICCALGLVLILVGLLQLSATV